MTREEADFIGGLNMCDEISNEAYKKIMCHCEDQEPFDEIIDKAVKEIFMQWKQVNPNYSKDWNEGFNDGMIHTITIIKGIRKGETQ